MIKKYVIIDGKPIIFPNEVIHSSVVPPVLVAESAGFFFILRGVSVDKPKVVCMGESTSLSISSRPQIDEKIIGQFLQLD